MPRKAVRVSLAIVVGLLYLWFMRATGEQYSWARDLGGYYDLLGRAFATGQLYLPIQPAPELLALPDPYDPNRNGPYALHDAVLYRGRYYLYHGAAPALMLFTPWRLIAGHDLPEMFAAFFFCYAGYLFSCALFVRILALLEIQPPLPLFALILLALGFCQLAPFLLSRVLVYEVAIAGGYFCLSAGFYFYARALGSVRWQPVWMALAGLLLGLAIGCRPHLAAAAAFAVLPLVFGKDRKRSAAVAFLLPVAACALALAAYNYARFGNPLEFGLRYQMAAANYQNIALAPQNMVPGLYYLLMAPPECERVFPFVRPAMRLPFDSESVPLPARYFLEPVAGVVTLWPIVVAALAMPLWIWWLPGRSGGRTVLWIVYLCAIGSLLFISATGLSSQRFAVDFLPGLVLIACVLMAAKIQRTVTAALAAVLVLYSVAAGLAFGVQGPFDELIRSRPEAYVRLARVFSPIQHFRPLLNPAVTVEAMFEFPGQVPGAQPLLSAGRVGSRYALSAEPLGGGRWRLVSEASRVSGNRATAEVVLAPGEPARVRLRFTPEDRTVTVGWNGQEVLRHRLEFLITAPAQVRVGIDLTETGWEKPKFAGRVAWQTVVTTAAR